MKKKMKLVSAIIGLICGALSYWFNPYNEMYVFGINIYFLMSSLAFLSAIFLGIIYREHIFRIPIYFCFGFVISALGRIFYDISNDPSSHNLFPFEIMFILAVIVPTSFIGAYTVNFIKKKQN